MIFNRILKFLLSLLSLIAISQGYAGSEIDIASLKHNLKTNTDPCVKTEILCRISKSYAISNADSSIFYAKQAILTSSGCGDNNREADAYLHHSTALDLAGNYTLAVESALKALHIFEKNGDKKSEAKVLYLLGKITFHQSESSPEEMRSEYYNDALSYYRRALAIEEKLNNLLGITDNQIEIGRTLFETGDNDSAMLMLTNTLEVSEQNKKQQPFLHNVAKSSYNIALIHIRKKDYQPAIKFLTKAAEVDSLLNNKEGVAVIRTAEMYLLMGNSDRAINLAKRSLDTALLYGYSLRVMQATDILYQGYALAGDFANAYHYLLMNTNLADSLNNAEHVRSITKMEMSYDFEKKQELEKLRHEAEKKQQLLVIYGVISALVLLLIFLIYGIRTFRQKQRAAKLIAEQKKEVETQKLIVEEKNREVHDSIVYAKRIQSAILPPDEVFHKIFSDSFIFYKPKDIVAGDFYFMEVVETGDSDEGKKIKVITAVADCTGHGVPGAMVSVVCHNALKRSIREDGLIVPGEILDRTREIIIEEFSRSGSGADTIKDGMDISLCCFTFTVDDHSAVTGTEIKNKKLESLTWSGANNPLWIIKPHQPDGSLHSGFIEYKPDKQPIGIHSKIHPFTTHEIKVNAGDSFYIFSDGYADQFGGEKTKKFKSSSIKELLLSINKKSMKEQKGIIDMTFEGWKGNIEQIDDVCMIGIRI